jgi:hypothetical protein
LRTPCSSARGNQVALPLQLQQIDRSREELAGFASANLEKIDVRRSEAEADEKSEGAVEKFLDGGGFAENGEGGFHIRIIVRTLREIVAALKVLRHPKSEPDRKPDIPDQPTLRPPLRSAERQSSYSTGDA